MKRRAFLRTLGTAATAAVVAPLLPLAPRVPDLGISRRVIAQYVPVTLVNRMDILYGYSCFQPNFAVRISA